MDHAVFKVLRFNEFALDLARGCLRSGSREIELRPKTFAVLRHLAENGGRLVPKQELYQAVWPDVVVSDDSLVQCIRELREKLGDQEHRLIKTLHRRGYLLDASVAVDDVSLAAADATRGSAVPSTASTCQRATIDIATQAPVLSLLSIAFIASALRASRAPKAATVAVGVTAFALAGLGLSQSVRSPSSPSTAAPPRVAKAESSGLGIPLGVQQFSTDTHAELAGLAEHVTRDLANYLSRVSILRVMTMNAPNLSVGREGKAGPRYIVHGDLRTQGERVRLNVGLRDAVSGAEVWSRHFAEDRKRWPTVQDDILRSITFSIHVEAPRHLATGALDATRDPPLDQLLRRGWAYVHAPYDTPSFDAAPTSFRAALRRDPDCPSALIGLAMYNLIAISHLKLSREPHLTEAEALLRRVPNTETRNHTLHYAFGLMHMLQRNLPAALHAFDRGIEINPSHPPTYARKGRLLITMQRYEEALDSLRYALRLNGATTAPAWHLWAGLAQLELGHDEEARTSVQAALGVLPNSPHVLATLASLHALRGEWAHADRQVAALRRNTPHLSDRQRLSRLNAAPDTKPLANRLGQGLRLALERQPEVR